MTHQTIRGASIFKMADQSRHKSMDTLRGYVRDAEIFKRHAGEGLRKHEKGPAWRWRGLVTRRSSTLRTEGSPNATECPSPSYSAGLEFELTGVAQGVELA